MTPNRSRFLRRKILVGVRPESGHSYVARVGLRGTSSHRRPSAAVLLEDGVPLPGPANAVHDEIRQVGGGRYSFWHEQVYFSASDNSDPRTNRRQYAFEYMPLFFRLLRKVYALLRRLAGPALSILKLVVLRVGRKRAHNEVFPIRPETGHCYVALVSFISGPSSHRQPSGARLLENGVPLPGPANAGHEEIRLMGQGRYSFWKGWVYFSTSDNSDPRTNGRRYTFDRSPFQKRLKEGILIVFHRYGFLFWDAFYWTCFYRVLRRSNRETGLSSRRK